MPFDQVTVRYGDTDITPFALVATGGSRAATMANGSVLHGVARAAREDRCRIAAELLEAAPQTSRSHDGAVSVVGTPSIALSFAELARIVAEEPERLPDDVDPHLSVSAEYDGGEGGWSGGTHCCFVEVDVETGFVEILRYVVVEDCGVPVNPAIVEGQVRGGVAQAIGAVLLEHSAYGDDGQFLAGTFMDYLMPTTTTVPEPRDPPRRGRAARPRRQLPGRGRGRDDRRARGDRATRSRTRSCRSACRCASSTCPRPGSSS